MKNAVLWITMVTLCAGPALAADVARLPDVYVEGVPTSYENEYNRGNALVAAVIQGTFYDLGPTYQAALDANGFSTDLIYDPYGTWPEMDDYLMVLVSTADMWWTYDWAADDAILSAYLDGGGTCAVIGQDYLYTRIQGTSGFPTDYLGIAGATQDVNWADEEVWWDGTGGGPLDGLSGYVPACFTDNPFFTDEIDPAASGVCQWTSATVPFPLEGGAATPTAIFSAVEFGCQDAAELEEIVAAMATWLDNFSPTQRSSWGRVKGQFRK
ncbi:MAG: hypothetical protein GF330_08685 [Candidatus Eisenbacteria bacterium]|nr:hypothetical protein [Candidatus Eisenbacteria bacterium]